MTAVTLKTGKSGVAKVEFSDGTSLLAATGYLPEEIFSEGSFSDSLSQGGCELSAAEEEAFRFAASCYRAESIALRLIARAEQHSRGLTAKLERRGFDADVANAVVLSFIDRGLLDDGRYAELWLRPRLAQRKAPSPRWLLASLCRRGIDREAAGAALKKALDLEAEYALLLRFLGKTKFPQGKKAGFFRAQLKNEGFSSSAIERYFDEHDDLQ